MKTLILNSKLLILLSLLITGLTFNSCQKKGCTDENAFNYDPDATEDDGSCIYPPGGGLAGDTLTEDITSATTISSNKLICSNIQVDADLTIEAGVTITFCNGNGIWVNSEGSINAEGTADDPIIFTGSTETEGWWDEINIKSNNPNNVFNHVVIKYGGSDDSWTGVNANVELHKDNSAQLTIKNTTLSNSKGVGMWVEGGANIAEFSSNTFKNNGAAGLRVGSVNLLGDLDAATTYNDNNTDPWIHVGGGNVTTEQTWANFSAPLYLGGHNIEKGVTIKPGVDVQFRSNGGLWIKNGAYLKAEGTSSDSITFDGETQTAGYWDEIKYNSNHPDNSLKYVTIKNGGSQDNWDTRNNLYINDNDGNEQLSLNNCHIANSYGWGVYVSNGATLKVNGSQATSESDVKSNNSFSSNGDEFGSCTDPCDVRI